VDAEKHQSEHENEHQGRGGRNAVSQQEITERKDIMKDSEENPKE